MIYYRIRPHCSDLNNIPLYLTLSAEQGKHVTVERLISDGKDSSQLWSPVEYISNGNEQCFVLLNRKNQQVIEAPNERAAVSLTSPDKIGGRRATWRFLNSSDSDSRGFGAIQLQQNDSMNLNVPGDGPYKPGSEVVVWDWGGGHQNEVWTFELVVDDTQPEAGI